MPAFKDITGQRFGRFITVKSVGSNKNKQILWEFRCDCGNIVVTPAGDKVNGRSKSCGCLKNESAKKRFTKHGDVGSTEWRTWRHIKDRCLNPNDKGFNNYGGRGIKICTAWIDSFETFLKDMGRKPTPKHSIDRIEIDGNYEPNNCRWATPCEQARNKRIHKNHKNGCAGLHFRERNSRWHAYIFNKGKQLFLGSFISREDAIKARKDAESKYWNAI